MPKSPEIRSTQELTTDSMPRLKGTTNKIRNIFRSESKEVLKSVIKKYNKDNPSRKASNIQTTNIVYLLQDKFSVQHRADLAKKQLDNFGVNLVPAINEDQQVVAKMTDKEKLKSIKEAWNNTPNFHTEIKEILIPDAIMQLEKKGLGKLIKESKIPKAEGKKPNLELAPSHDHLAVLFEPQPSTMQPVELSETKTSTESKVIFAQNTASKKTKNWISMSSVVMANKLLRRNAYKKNKK